jgi:hypothetical protein
MKNNLKILISIIICCIYCSQSIYAQKQQKLKKEEIEKLIDSLNDSKNLVKVLNEKISNIEKSKNKLESELQESKQKKINNPETLFADLDYRTIGPLKWASKNLDVKQVVSIFDKIEEAKDSVTWNKCALEKKPAYCFHNDDIEKKYGVLLNIPALILLSQSKKLQESNWRLPEQADFDSVTKILLSSKSTDNKIINTITLLINNSKAPNPAWKKPGVDLFDMHIAPLSFRLNNTKEWYGGDAASFFCYEKAYEKLDDILLIAEINDTEKNRIVLREQDLLDKYNNFGVFVRLIHK